MYGLVQKRCCPSAIIWIWIWIVLSRYFIILLGGIVCVISEWCFNLWLFDDIFQGNMYCTNHCFIKKKKGFHWNFKEHINIRSLVSKQFHCHGNLKIKCKLWKCKGISKYIRKYHILHMSGSSCCKYNLILYAPCKSVTCDMPPISLCHVMHLYDSQWGLRPVYYRKTLGESTFPKLNLFTFSSTVRDHTPLSVSYS